jgi:hypothetical protein
MKLARMALFLFVVISAFPVWLALSIVRDWTEAATQFIDEGLETLADWLRQ